MPGYTGHLAGIKADGLNIGQTTHKKLENAMTIVPEEDTYMCTSEYIAKSKIGKMPEFTKKVTRQIS